MARYITCDVCGEERHDDHYEFEVCTECVLSGDVAMFEDSRKTIERQQAYIEKLEEWIVELNGFRACAASTIKSGEPWTDVMQAAFDRSERPVDIEVEH